MDFLGWDERGALLRNWLLDHGVQLASTMMPSRSGVRETRGSACIDYFGANVLTTTATMNTNPHYKWW